MKTLTGGTNENKIGKEASITTMTMTEKRRSGEMTKSDVSVEQAKVDYFINTNES